MNDSVPVSVIIPCYNSSGTIERAVQSILCQTKWPKEIILVNDCSNDNGKTLQILYKLKKKYENNIKIIIFELEKNQGVSSARNAGMKIAKEKYIAFLDSDDEWEKDKLRKQMIILKLYPQVGLIGTNRNGEKFKRFFWKKFNDYTIVSYHTLLFKNFFSPSTVILKKEVVDKLGYFNTKKRYGEDVEYFLRIAINYQCLLINESLVICDKGKPTFGYKGLSSDLYNMEIEELKNFQYLYNSRKISFYLYLLVSSYSMLKFLRRVLITKLRKRSGGII